MAFFPKCPVCWATYLSVFGVLGVAQLPRPGWLYPLLVALLGVHLLLVWRRAPQAGYGPIATGLGGALLILLGRQFAPGAGWIALGGILLLAASSLWDSSRTAHRLSRPSSSTPTPTTPH